MCLMSHWLIIVQITDKLLYYEDKGKGYTTLNLLCRGDHHFSQILPIPFLPKEKIIMYP
jgi:hypothetical protein